MELSERVAGAAVAEAGTRLRAVWRGSKVIDYKGPIDLVTETDREVEALVAGHLREAFPDHLILAEEASHRAMLAAPADTRHIWYLDPLDGTTNFAHG